MRMIVFLHKNLSWIGGNRPSDTARAALDCVEKGLQTVKMNGIWKSCFP
ncbi:hypothetical protein [Gottfriedia acidiceleris]